MTFTRANPLGWALYEIFLSSQCNAMDINISRALDGYNGGVYSPTASLTWNHQLIVDATTAIGTNLLALEITGKGSGAGIDSTGGSSTSVAGQGGIFQGGSPSVSGHGARGISASGGAAPGSGNGGTGAYLIGGSSLTGSPGTAGYGIGGSSLASGDAGHGFYGEGGVAVGGDSGHGLYGVGGFNAGGGAAGAGVVGEGGASDGHGGMFTADGDGIGCIGFGDGKALVNLTSAMDGAGVVGLGSFTTTSASDGGYFVGGVPSTSGLGGNGVTVIGGTSGAASGDGGHGGHFTAGNTNTGTAGNGVHGIGGDHISGTAGIGVVGEGGASDGHGGMFTADGDGIGVMGFGSGKDLTDLTAGMDGAGVVGIADNAGAVGVIGIGGATNGNGGSFTGTGTGYGGYFAGGATGAPIFLFPRGSDPAGGAAGSIYPASSGHLKSYFGSAYRYVGVQAFANLISVGGGSSTVNIQDSLNVASATATTTHISVTFTQGFTLGNYALVATAKVATNTPYALMCVYTNKTASGFDIELWDSNGARKNIQTSGEQYDVSIACWGD